MDLANRSAGRENSNGAGQAERSVPDDRYADPGYYLMSGGRTLFEREIGFEVPWRRRILRFYVRAAAPGYVGAIALLTAAFLALPLLRSWELGTDRFHLILIGLLAAVPASELAIALINRSVTDLFGPLTLPRLEIRGIPDQLRTMVAVPALLTSEEAINELTERLEIHFLANPDGNLRFALLSDWVDAASESLPNDANLLGVASNAMARLLNERHGPAADGGNRFFLLHRKRLWNPSEGKWMGWERKRGKPARDEPAAARREANTTFITASGLAPEPIPGIRYVITLDADTRLPRGAATRLIGTMAHPLNRAKYNAAPAGARGGGLRHCAAAHHSLAAQRPRGLALPADFLRPERHRSLRFLGFRRLPGPFPRGLLHRQRNLRPGHLRNRAGRQDSREHPAESRSLRGNLCPHSTGQRHRALRRISFQL